MLVVVCSISPTMCSLHCIAYLVRKSFQSHKKLTLFAVFRLDEVVSYSCSKANIIKDFWSEVSQKSSVSPSPIHNCMS